MEKRVLFKTVAAAVGIGFVVGAMSAVGGSATDPAPVAATNSQWTPAGTTTGTPGELISAEGSTPYSEGLAESSPSATQTYSPASPYGPAVGSKPAVTSYSGVPTVSTNYGQAGAGTAIPQPYTVQSSRGPVELTRDPVLHDSYTGSNGRSYVGSVGGDGVSDAQTGEFIPNPY